MIAPPHFLSLIATLMVHPKLTTRAKTADQTLTTSLAARYLRVLLETVGPTQSGLADAFAFTFQGAPSRNGRVKRRKAEDGEATVKDGEKIGNELANTASLWSKAEDLWQVIGWAFNCSVLHKRRWEVWQSLLEYVIDVLEADWSLRFAEGHESLSKSLIVQYIRGDVKLAGNDTRVLRAIFADGTGRAINEFKEIWQNETKERVKAEDIQKAERKIDIEADDYGDYMDEDDEIDLEESPESVTTRSEPPMRTNKKSKPINLPNGTDLLGGVDALNLRLRLLSLLSHVSAQISGRFITTQDLYELYLRHIRPLPLPTFFCIISPAGLRHFDLSAASSLTQYLLLTILSSSAPQPPNDHLNQEVLQRCYLPWQANLAGPAENAKVSLCVETLLRLLDREGALEGTQELLDAAEKGIEARKSLASGKKGKGGRRSNGATGGDVIWLEGSAVRIRAVVKMAISRTERENASQGST